MLYGLYLSATGIITSSYKQDLVSNNLANSETAGFKRDVASFQQRLTEAQAQGRPGLSNQMLEKLGGGTFASPTLVDSRQGDLEETGNSLDVGIVGNGFFAVQDKGQSRLTRDGQFAVDRKGQLILSNGEGQAVLDPKGKPITLEPGGRTMIGEDGTITQNGKAVGQVGLFDVANSKKLRKEGGSLLSYGDEPLVAATGTMKSEFVERANVDPATELADLMETQRTLEANANMIRYQDQTLGRLVNEVGKIG